MKALLVTILICVFFQANAQDSLTISLGSILQFTYDDSGNQIERKFNSSGLKQGEENLSLSEQFEDKINIYPNPTRGKFYIEWEKEVSSYISFVEVLSTSAIIQTIRTESHQNMLNIDLTSKQSGIYFVRFIFTDGSSISKKVIKL